MMWLGFATLLGVMFILDLGVFSRKSHEIRFREALSWTLKTIRYRFIHVCGKIIKTGRRFYCKIMNVTQEVFELFRNCKSKPIITDY